MEPVKSLSIDSLSPSGLDELRHDGDGRHRRRLRCRFRGGNDVATVATCSSTAITVKASNSRFDKTVGVRDCGSVTGVCFPFSPTSSRADQAWSRKDTGRFFRVDLSRCHNSSGRPPAVRCIIIRPRALNCSLLLLSFLCRHDLARQY